MTHDTKTLFKSAAGNVVTIAGYVSTAATFLPIMVVVRPYVRPFGIVLIIVGIFRGAQSVIATKNKQCEAVKAAKDTEIASLNERIELLSRKPYTDELERITKQVLDYEMTLEGRHILRHLMIHEPVEVGRVFFPEIPQERQHAPLAIAMQHGVVQHKEEVLGLRRTYWVINPRFRPVLEDLLYEGRE